MLTKHPGGTRFAAALASLALAATSANAAPVQTKVFSTSELAYSADVSNSDLLTGLTATTTGWNTTNGSTTAQLHDGIHGRTFATAGNRCEGAWTTVGATAIYNLGLGTNGLGYNLTSIQTIAAWVNVGFGNQAYTVDVKLKGAASYTTLATVGYEPLNNPTPANNIGATKVTLTDSTGVLASGVEFIRFTANSVNGGANSGAFVFREIDVFGTPTANTTPPQISTLAPMNNASGVLVGANLVATFNENIARGTGNITIRNLSAPTQSVIPVGDSQVSVSGSVLSINPTADLAALKNYAIRIDAGAITDLSGNPFAGISNDTGWNFTTGSTSASTPLRIMCLGDSITAGYTDNPTWNVPFMFGYRSGLFTRLTNADYNFKLVGASAEPWNGAFPGDPTHGGTYTPALDLRAFGQDGHRGYGGVSIGTVNSNVSGYIAADTPNVILLLIGINGIGSGSPATLNTLVNTIVTAAPNAHLIVAQITPLASFNQDLYNYNLYIRNTLVPTYAASGHKVTTVNLYSLFLTNPNDYASAITPNVLANGINHPDNAHYDLMAQEWFNGIEALGLGPNTFKHWIAGFPGVGAFTGFNDDPDGDGIPNALEAWFGTNPGQSSQGLLAGTARGGTFTFTHPRNANPPSDLSGFYQWSPNLVDWFAGDGLDGPPGGATVTLVPSITGATATVTATPTKTLNRLFLRAGVIPN